MDRIYLPELVWFAFGTLQEGREKNHFNVYASLILVIV
jgi:hypothetical protein